MAGVVSMAVRRERNYMKWLLAIGAMRCNLRGRTQANLFYREQGR